MIIELPTATDLARYSFQIELDKVYFGFVFEWSERAGHWLFDIKDSQGTPLVCGRRVVIGMPLLNRFPDPRLPKGMLFAVDTSGADLEAGFADLGDRVKLYYQEVADMDPALVQDVG